jgi:16S rRNA (guanine966-N2)-methyltransferase
VRIIGGTLRGRRLAADPASATRPTSDRVREALASALHARALLADARVLDLFAGTGALGFEALSRGAHSLLAVDLDAIAVAGIAANARALGIDAHTRVLRLDLLGPIAKLATALRRTEQAPFTLVFADPPYTLSERAAAMLGELAAHTLLAEGAVVAFEHAVKHPPTRPAAFSELATYAYGDTGVSLWEMIAWAPET